MRFSRIAASAAALLAASGSSLAAENVAPTPAAIAPAIYAAPVSPFGGVISAWGLGVLPLFYHQGSEDCDDLGDDELCGFGFGGGGYTALAGRSGDWAFVWDLLVNYHTETHTDPAGRDDPALYGATGVHIARENGDNAFGLFGVAAAGWNHADSDWTGFILGGGAEVRLGDFYVQGGALFHLNDDDDQDSFVNLFFARGVQEIALGDGLLQVGVAGGFGDFRNLSATTDAALGMWLQFGIQLEAPIGQSNLHWLLAYQGDFVMVTEEFSDTERVFFNRLQIGLTVPLGGGRNNVIFTTPDFTVPVTNAGELN